MERMDGKKPSQSEAMRLAEIFPKLMTALSHLTHAEDLVHENLTPSQLKVLNILDSAPGPMRMSEIAKGLRVTQATLTETAKKLSAQGYINRARKADDDRVVHVSLTPQGREQANQMLQKTHRFFNLICDGLNPKDRRKLVESHEFIFKTYTDAVTKNDHGKSE